MSTTPTTPEPTEPTEPALWYVAANLSLPGQGRTTYSGVCNDKHRWEGWAFPTEEKAQHDLDIHRTDNHREGER